MPAPSQMLQLHEHPMTHTTAAVLCVECKLHSSGSTAISSRHTACRRLVGKSAPASIALQPCTLPLLLEAEAGPVKGHAPKTLRMKPLRTVLSAKSLMSPRETSPASI